MHNTLIIDDEQSVHQAIRSLVDWASLGLHEPQSAYNGVEALHLMESLRPGIAFVDMNMPLMDGVTFLSKATERFADTQFIVVSGYDSFDFARAAIRYNVLDYLLKPIDVDELHAALKKAVSLMPQPPRESRLPADIAAEIRAYIDAHYGEDISLDRIADMFYFSREYVSRIFRAQYGCAVYEYIQQVRMEQALRLLRNPKLSLQTIADCLGYSNANYFSKAFRRFYGISPRGYRNREMSRERNRETP